MNAPDATGPTKSLLLGRIREKIRSLSPPRERARERG